MDWRVFFLTFATLFVAELGDKTQLATIAMVTEHKTPVAVFLGASLALAAVTLLGVVFGQVITQVIPPRMLRLASGVMFIAIGGWVLFDALRTSG
ncbi:MAG: TMEM165/GDT1 family protein [Chloroflexi bacterium]|nr:TMEM165/GDT1 family protein [Chloroflexota bacterium]MBU1749853.1 TMEM165/GDT1 family protein [Chloroflexota bacterium]